MTLRDERKQAPAGGLPARIDQALNKYAPSVARVMDRAVEAVSPITAMRREEARMRLDLQGSSGFAFRGAERSRLMSDWLASLSRDADAPSMELETLRDRSRYLNRNDPLAVGARDTYAINIVGSGLKPQSRLRADVLGISEDRERLLRKQAERVFEKWSPYADSCNMLSFDEIQFLAIQKIVEDGEAICLPVWTDETWKPYRRAIEMVESEWLCSTNSAYEHGIKKGKRGQPLSYFFNDSDQQQREIKARDKDGRPQVIHCFPQSRVGQTRGVPMFAPVIQLFKHLGDAVEAKVVSARVAACLSVFVTQQDSYLGALGNTSSSEASTSKRIQEVEPGLVHYLGLGESVNTVEPKGTGDEIQNLVESIVRLVGVSFGLPYELLMKDFSKTNYSSARASLLQGYRMFTRWRKWFAWRLCQPVWELVLEEAYLRGEFEVDGLWKDHKLELCRSVWVGGAWGFVEPVKEVMASKKAIDYGISTQAEECAAQGRDWEEVMIQRAREESKKKELGLSTTDEQPPGGTETNFSK